MKLPNADRAFIDIKKLENYCLNPFHPRGKHKARVFASSLGLTKDNAMELKEEIVKAISEVQCRIAEADQYGRRYVVDFSYDRGNLQAKVRTSWIIKFNEDFPRMVSCYIL